MKPVASSRGRGVYLINNVSVQQKDWSSITLQNYASFWAQGVETSNQTLALLWISTIHW